MSVLSLLAFSLPILTGTLIVHLLWIGKNNPIELLLKLFLGMGLGLGISSLLYFAYLIFFAGRPYFLYVELALFFIVLAAVYTKHKKTVYVPSPRLSVSFLQIVILIIAGFVSVSSFLGLINYSRQRGHGDWDAWMIYNRAARFIYRDQETWQNAFSRDMDLVFHADYPPLLALNIASRWDILNEETIYVPMIQGFLFSLAALGLCFGALASLKSLGQGALGLILLSGVTLFMGEGGRQTADVPMAYYMLASVVFLFFYYHEKRAILMVLAGFMAGLAAWTKNEGILFLCATTGIIGIAALWKRSLQSLLFYFSGLFLPLAFLFYFKSQLAPSSEFLSAGGGKIIQDLTDTSRHQMIFNAFKGFLLHSGGWNNVGIFLVLFGYLLIFHSRIKDNPEAVFIGLAIFVCQIIGYYVSYLISPYDLQWHISYSLNRLFVQIYPATVFLVLAASRLPETIFSSNRE
jgi:hypothetical protein